jgi:hypothetical protein
MRLGEGQSWPSRISCFLSVTAIPVSLTACQFRQLADPVMRDRWCKPCGARTGQAQPGVWYFEGAFDENDDEASGYVEASTVPLRGGLACAICRKSNFPSGLYWGCGDCFRKEKARRRDVELLSVANGRALPPATASWVKKKLRNMSILTTTAESTISTATPTPRRETRCEACWRFPSRSRDLRTDAVFDSLPYRQWCEPCQALRRELQHKKLGGNVYIPRVASLREVVTLTSASTILKNSYADAPAWMGQ